METFIKRKAALRKERKMTQQELAKLFSSSISVVSRNEREENKPSIDVALKNCRRSWRYIRLLTW